jgi:hypothetical protein
MNTPREKIIEVMCDGWDLRPVSIETRCRGLLTALEAAGYQVRPENFPARNASERRIEELNAELKAARLALDGAKETLDMIAGQHLKGEGDDETVDDGDYEGAYDEIVGLARTAVRLLSKKDQTP